MSQLDVVRTKYAAIRDDLNERSRRLWAGVEAAALGRGGVVLVARATGLAVSTVVRGRQEVLGPKPERGEIVRVRRRGAGRYPLEKKRPEIVDELEKLVTPLERGDPESPLRWTTKSLRTLSRQLKQQGLVASPAKLSELLRERGYSLQGVSRVKEGEQHPDRDRQFEHINSRTEAFIKSGLPVISVDTKKKEQLGDYGRPGREWRPKSEPLKVKSHDFLEKDGLKAVPYGVYDIAANDGFINVGVDHDTPRFAVRSIAKWWDQIGSKRYPQAKHLYITADAGGSNSAVSRAWKHQLQQLADKHRLAIDVSHFPPGTSKWNKIEHRLFSFVTLNWRGRPLYSYETILSLINATTTAKGLRVRAQLDEDKYAVGDRVSEHQMEHLCLRPDEFRGQWNYRLEPRTSAQIAEAARPEPRRASCAETWGPVVEKQVVSGLNSHQYCKRHRINYDAFICARRKLKGLIRPKASTARHLYLAKIRHERGSAK
jgi:hypothetical protein